MHRLTIAVVAVLAAALAVVSLSAAASHRAQGAHRYHRIISLSPTATEDLFAIGAGKQVVAVDADSAINAAGQLSTPHARVLPALIRPVTWRTISSTPSPSGGLSA